MPARPAKPPPAFPAVTPASLQWRSEGPYAEDYEDIYFARDGVAEVQRVFMQPAQIEQRMAGRSDFCIGELGFGTGLNFAVTAQACLARSPGTRLHFVSFEKHPLVQSDWQRVNGVYAAQLPIYRELAAQPLPVLPGWHQRVVADGLIRLSVFHGDVQDGLQSLLQQQRNPVDAWFLDGFAPDKNPAMWGPELFAQLGHLSAPGTTVTTFTAAGRVRRALSDVGFEMRRVDQRPHKRESLAGSYLPPSPHVPSVPARVQVLGAGIAGASVARHLAELGVPVTVYDPHGIAAGASGIHAAVLHARLLGDGSPAADLRCSAFHYASNYLKRFDGYAASGALQLQGPNLDQKKLDRVCAAYQASTAAQAFWLQRVDAAQAQRLSGINCKADALLFPTAGTVDLKRLCQALLDHPAIRFTTSEPQHAEDQPRVLCSGSAVRLHPGCEWLEIKDVHGQLDRYRLAHPPHMPVVGNGYLVPGAAADGTCTFGATYEYQPWSLEQATAHNLALNQPLLAAADKANTLHWLDRVRGPRAVSSDRSPVVGEMGDGLWVASGFGSQGTTAAPLAGAHIAAALCGWLPPVSAREQYVLRPQRFAERQARRGVRHISD